MQSPEMRLNIMEKNESSVYETIRHSAQLGHRRIGGIFCIDEWTVQLPYCKETGIFKSCKADAAGSRRVPIGQIHGDDEKSSLISVIEEEIRYLRSCQRHCFVLAMKLR